MAKSFSSFHESEYKYLKDEIIMMYRNIQTLLFYTAAAVGATCAWIIATQASVMFWGINFLKLCPFIITLCSGIYYGSMLMKFNTFVTYIQILERQFASFGVGGWETFLDKSPRKFRLLNIRFGWQNVFNSAPWFALLIGSGVFYFVSVPSTPNSQSKTIAFVASSVDCGEFRGRPQTKKPAITCRLGTSVFGR